MGQSVHATGFRLSALRNWKVKRCILEKERYVQEVRREWLIQAYIRRFFQRELPKRIRFLTSLGFRISRARLKSQKMYREKAYIILHEKWKRGLIAKFDEKETDLKWLKEYEEKRKKSKVKIRKKRIKNGKK